MKTDRQINSQIVGQREKVRNREKERERGENGIWSRRRDRENLTLGSFVLTEMQNIFNAKSL